MAEAAAPAPADDAAVAAPAKKHREVHVQIPEGVTPGDTKMGIDLSDSENKLVVTVPHEAQPGDHVVLIQDPQTKEWSMTLLSSRPQHPSTMMLYRVDVNAERCYERLVEAAVAAGAYVSPKIGRAVVDGLVGMVAQEALAKGEEIARMPFRLMISRETVDPAFFAAVERVEKQRPQAQAAPHLTRDTAVGAAVTRLLGEAVDRIEQRVQVVIDGTIASVWATYCDALLGEHFDNHPYLRWVLEPDKLIADLWPSCEGEYAKLMASDIIHSCHCIKQNLPVEQLGKRFEAGLFLKARLCMVSRVFHTTPEYSSLVPVMDLFNHSTDPTIDYSFDHEKKEMVMVANREHAKGDQLWITYGFRPNPLLLRVYGFTVPPEIEPSWTYVLQGSKTMALDVLRRYFPASQVGSTQPFMDTRLVQDSFIDILNDCKANGGDTTAFLRELCAACMAEYEREQVLQPALEALRRARAKDPAGAAWWSELDSVRQDQAAAAATTNGEDAYWHECCLRTKMSEYLCLVAHAEAVEVFEEKLDTSRCLREASTVRELIVSALDQLRTCGVTKLQTMPAS